jgi:hypothetical protein
MLNNKTYADYFRGVDNLRALAENIFSCISGNKRSVNKLPKWIS